MVTTTYKNTNNTLPLFWSVKSSVRNGTCCYVNGQPPSINEYTIKANVIDDKRIKKAVVPSWWIDILKYSWSTTAKLDFSEHKYKQKHNRYVSARVWYVVRSETYFRIISELKNQEPFLNHFSLKRLRKVRSTRNSRIGPRTACTVPTVGNTHFIFSIASLIAILGPYR